MNLTIVLAMKGVYVGTHLKYSKSTKKYQRVFKPRKNDIYSTQLYLLNHSTNPNYTFKQKNIFHLVLKKSCYVLHAYSCRNIRETVKVYIK